MLGSIAWSWAKHFSFLPVDMQSSTVALRTTALRLHCTAPSRCPQTPYRHNPNRLCLLSYRRSVMCGASVRNIPPNTSCPSGCSPPASTIQAGRPKQPLAHSRRPHDLPAFPPPAAPAAALSSRTFHSVCTSARGHDKQERPAQLRARRSPGGAPAGSGRRRGRQPSCAPDASPCAGCCQV